MWLSTRTKKELENPPQRWQGEGGVFSSNFEAPLPFRTTTSLTDGISQDQRDKVQSINQYSQLNSVIKQKQVYLAKDENGRDVILKIMKRLDPEEKKNALRRSRQRTEPRSITADNIRKEIAVLGQLRHSHLVHGIEVIDIMLRPEVYLVMEYLSGGPVSFSVDDEVSGPVLTLTQTRRIMRDVINGLEFLHYKGITHRDIKPANIVYTKNRAHVKLIDFGASFYHSSQRQDPEPLEKWPRELSSLKRVIGTPAFMSPEVLFVPMDDVERPPTTHAIDIWSLGVTFYCFLFGQLPFQEVNSGNMHRARMLLNESICQDTWTLHPTMGAERVSTKGTLESSSSCIQLLEGMLKKDPRQRLTLAQLKRNPWMLSGISNSEQWLQETSPGPISTFSH